MADTDDEEQVGGLDVQLAQELIDRAKQQGVSLVGPDGLLAGVTKTVLQAALEALAHCWIAAQPQQQVAGEVLQERAAVE